MDDPFDGLAEFSIRDQDAWEKWVRNNTDPYGRCVITFAARWAHAMEKAMAATPGATVAAVASLAEKEADTEGITGFMYGAAVSALATVWEHGEELRCWHNREYGRADANNTPGSVVNPAIITIGSKR